MRKIEKPKTIPTKLVKIHSLIANDLYVKKEIFKWRGEYYSDPIKEDLEKLYHNKCGFCEIKLQDENDGYDKFTVEHFRPKSHYYWLGAEWTNLFPSCKRCNENKDDYFPLQFEMKRVKKENAPFDSVGNIIFSECLASSKSLLYEQPLYLHPELDNPLDYFEINVDAEIIIKSSLDKFHFRRAEEMRSKFLGNKYLENKRKPIINHAKALLRSIVENFLEYSSNPPTNGEFSLAFFPFFKKLFITQDISQEFSLVGYYMNENFDEFFLEEYESNVQNLIKYAYSLFLEENSKKNF
jgi:uncharacterized protein (TIGR02646 family)